MKTEKHTIKNRYSTHGIHRNIPVYEMNTIHCSASPMEGYKGTEVTLIDNAAWNEKFSAWALTGATATGNNIVLNNDVTAQGRYETAKNIQVDGCTVTPTSGFIGTVFTAVPNTPAWNEKLSSYNTTGATHTGNNFTITGNSVIISAGFETAKNVKLQTDGHGTIAASRVSGFIGDQVVLSNTANNNYKFSKYTIIGANLTGNKFNFIGNNVTAKAWFVTTTGTSSTLFNFHGAFGQIGYNQELPFNTRSFSEYSAAGSTISSRYVTINYFAKCEKTNTPYAELRFSADDVWQSISDLNACPGVRVGQNSLTTYNESTIITGSRRRTMVEYQTSNDRWFTPSGDYSTYRKYQYLFDRVANSGSIYIDNTWLATGPISQFTTLNFKVGISNKPVEMTVSALNMSQFSNYNKALEHLGVS